MRAPAAAVILLSALCASPAPAAIFAQRDAGGAMVYSNVPARADARAAVIEVSTRPRAVKAAFAQPADFPRIERAEQRQRDLGRDTILSHELDSEEQLLSRARALKAAPDVQHRHLSNIAALKRELAALR